MAASAMTVSATTAAAAPTKMAIATLIATPIGRGTMTAVATGAMTIPTTATAMAPAPVRTISAATSANSAGGSATPKPTRTMTIPSITDCRQSVDPAGVIAGALIGGLLGNAVGRGGGRGGATVAGVIVGGALGATLTRNLDCEDRSYAYKTYYDGFNAGRPNARYEWRNPRNGHYGNFLVRDYYNDPDGFRCANFHAGNFHQWASAARQRPRLPAARWDLGHCELTEGANSIRSRV